MTLSEVIKKFREDNNLTMEEFANRTSLSKGYISMLENRFKPVGRKKDIVPSIMAIKKLSQGMGVDFDYLLSLVDGDVSLKLNDDEEMYKSANIDFIRIPLYSPLCCGNGGFVDDNIVEYVPVPSKGLSSSSNYFCQTADGESMKDAGINNGDLLVFEMTPKINPGVIGCFCIDENKAMCKKYKKQNGIIMLQPMNSECETIPVDPLNNSFKCLGVLKKVIKDFYWED